MNDGEISGNSASVSGGGIYLDDYWNDIFSFIKTGGVIYGYNEGDPKSNTVKNPPSVILNNKGHAIFAYSIDWSNNGVDISMYKDTTLSEEDDLTYGLLVSPSGWD
jgi:hypothetical protein